MNDWLGIRCREQSLLAARISTGHQTNFFSLMARRANRAESTGATALVARLIASGEPIAGIEADRLQAACTKVTTIGVQFGATYAALVNVSALLPGFTAHEQLSTKAVLAENIVAFLQAQKEPEAEQPNSQTRNNKTRIGRMRRRELVHLRGRQS